VNIRTLTTLLGAASLSIVLVGATTATRLDASAQAPPAQAQQQSQSIEGQLVDVNADTSTLVIKSTSGEVQIRYNEQTQVAGATGGVAGLASMKDRQVRVDFIQDAKTKARLATRIVVQGQ
jgi:hypothetical protein